MRWIDVVRKVNERLVKIAENIAEKYNLNCKIFDMQEYFESCYQLIKVSYTYINGLIDEKPIEIEYEHIYKEDKILIKVNKEKITCRKIDNFTEKALSKIEEKFPQKIENVIANFAKYCKEYDKRLVIKTKIANILESKIGLKPYDLYYDGREYIAFFSRSNKNERIELKITGEANEKEIKVTRIEIITGKESQILQHYIWQIFQIFKE